MLYVFVKVLMVYISCALESKLKLFLVYTARVISEGWGTPGSSLSGYSTLESGSQDYWMTGLLSSLVPRLLPSVWNTNVTKYWVCGWILFLESELKDLQLFLGVYSCMGCLNFKAGEHLFCLCHDTHLTE